MAWFWRRVFALVALAGVLSLASGLPARADDTPSSWAIRRYDVAVDLDRAGTADVTLSLDFDFGGDDGHGPILVLPTRQAINDPGKWLDLGVEIVSVTSPTGADTTVTTTSGSEGNEYRIGAKGKLYTGVQTYVIRCRLTGLVAQRNAESGLDEFNWNVIGTAWKVPIDRVQVQLSGPSDIIFARCFTDTEYRTPCQANANGATASYSVNDVGTGKPAQIAAGFPADTFTGITQTFSRRYYLGNTFPLTPATGAVTVLLTVCGCWLVFRQIRRKHADETYLGVAPGMTPGVGQPTAVGKVDRSSTVAVQFHPPEGASPAELGVLLDSTANNIDITAFVLDLAVRGHLMITSRQDGHTFTRTWADESDLAPYEACLLERIFNKGSSIDLSDLKDQSHSTLISRTRDDLYGRVAELGWFKQNPVSNRLKVVAAGIGFIMLGVVFGLVGAYFGWGLVGIPFLIVGTLVIALHKKFNARTAAGSAVLAQAKGFKLYLSTAEADQIRFEESIDVFSRYLPYAVIFGVAERWVKIFKELDQGGIYSPDTTWYHGMDLSMLDAMAFSSALHNLTDSMSDVLNSARLSAGTAGSSGGSGSSGGGGFGGGGGGGW